MPTKEQARQVLQNLITQYATDRSQNLSESDVIEKYLLPLFRDVLGWPTDDYEHFRNEVTVSGGRVDRLLIADNGERIYIEAKRFKVIETLEKIEAERYIGEMRRAEKIKNRRLNDALGPQQLALPTMAVDRTAEEQQAINYAFQNDGQWAILANFEVLRLFNARRDWLVLSFESPAAYLQDFDLLWQLSYESILGGSLDYLSNQRFRVDVDSKYLALINTWRQELANDLLQTEDKNPWIRKDGKLDLLLIRSVVQRIIDRLVVVRFAEDHLVIPPGTLYGFYELRRNNFYAQSLIEMVQPFFRKFDEAHNSALFSESILDRALFTDKVLMQLVSDLYKVKFRAMPADILGNTYEQYLGKALVLDGDKIDTRDNLETRKKQGSYYTPQVIVRYMVDNSLGRYLYGTDNGKPDGELLDGETRKNSRDIMDLRVLDSACGSGSFLIYAYQVLRDFYESEIARLDSAYKEGIAEIAAKFGEDTFDDSIRVKQYEIERDRIRNYPTIILEQHIYGVDLDPQAAEIAVVNLMMRAMEKQGAEKRLPLILNQNVKVGNALIGIRPDDPRLSEHSASLGKILKLRADLKATINTDPEHERIFDNLNTELDTVRTALDSNYAEHFTDLERVRLFHWAVEFPEAFVDENGTPLENPGFQVIIGNPPWEIVKPDLREFFAQFDENIESRLSRAKAETRIEELNAENPELEPQWQAQKTGIEAQASYYRATDDYTKQGRGDTATHKLFVERVYGLLRDSGRLGYVVPSGIYTDLGTKQLREMFLNEGGLERLVSITNGVSGGEIYFHAVHRSYKIALFVAIKSLVKPKFHAMFRIDPRITPKPDEFSDETSNRDNFIKIDWDSVKKFSPTSLSLMEFTSQLDANIVGKMYNFAPLIGAEIENTWSVKLNIEFHTTNDRDKFNISREGYPLYEGKMIHQYDSNFADAQYWISKDVAIQNFRQRKSETAQVDYLIPRLGFREITFATNERSLIATILPPNVCCNHKIMVVAPRLSSYSNKEMFYTLSFLNSLSQDFIVRFKITSGMSMFHFYQLPLPRLSEGNPYFDALVQRAAQLTCVREEFADLWSEVMGTKWTLKSPPDTSGGDLEGGFLLQTNRVGKNSVMR